MLFDDSQSFGCPYCGSDNFFTIDPSGGRRQKFVLDCEICCQPIVVEISSSDGLWSIDVRRENE